ncbi:hypothetical protein PISL3812_01229 [Talaromyces islandicus]|uniref:Uncharacterized protein n=1 Tax=Talaromyces islandicus TaxID=28573 RepID=A0A0U1LLJ0_TALIS|nr:hypothetical protein PISL3812_01229 [Talaromyces islandicus]
MGPKKEKKQANDERDQRHKEKRAKRRTYSSSEEHETEPSNSSHSVRTNGVVKDDSLADQARSLCVNDTSTTKFLSFHETFQNLSEVSGVLRLIKDDAAKAAGIFRPEIELRAENERLQQTVNWITSAVETQKVQELEQRCHKLEQERVNLDRIQQDIERERQNIEKERKDILTERENMENELEKRTETGKAKLSKVLAQERRSFEADLASAKKSEKEAKELNADLKKECEESEKKVQNLEEGNNTLMARNRMLRSELDKERSRFSVHSKGIEYYQANFTELYQKLKDLVHDFVTGPMSDDQLDAVDATDLGKQDFFKFVPPRNSGVAQYLWRHGTQAYISSQICEHIWQSFPCSHLQEFTDPSTLRNAFDKMSRKYAQVNIEKEAIWRSMTYEILNSFHAQLSVKEQSHRELVSSIAKTLDPIVGPSKKKDFAMALTEIVNEASSLWSAVKTDTARIHISVNPPDESEGEWKWEAASLEGIETLECPENINIPDAHSLCLFPSITATDASGEDEMVCPGQTLFADCVAFALGYHEQQESARELAQKERELRYNYRKNSLSS